MKIARIFADGLPIGEQQTAWLAALASLSLRAEAAPAAPGWIAMRETPSNAFLAMLAGGPQTFRPLARSGAVWGAASGGEAPVIVALMLRGRARLVAEARRIECASNDLLALDTGGDWRLEARGDIELVLLGMPRAPLMSRLGRNAGGLGASVLGTTVAALAAKPLLRTVGQNFGEADAADLSAVEVALTELVSSALLAEAVAPDGALSQIQAEHFRRIAAAIDTRLTDPTLAVTTVARQEGFSVRYLQRLFALRGESFSDYLRRERLERCRAELADPNHARESVGIIAHRWGFRDQAHFTRAFGAAFGLTPTEVRRQTAPPLGPAFRGMPAQVRRGGAGTPRPPIAGSPAGGPPIAAPGRHHLPAHAGTVHWGYLSRTLPPVLRVDPGTVVTVETLTQHGGDDLGRFVTGDPGAESVFAWTHQHKAVDRRGAGPMNASIFGRGAGEEFGVHICTGPIHVRGAEPGDVLEVGILDIAPRPCANPAHAGKAFASNVSAWWGYQYDDPLPAGRTAAERREVVTIYEIDLADPGTARALYSYRWTPRPIPSACVMPGSIIRASPSIPPRSCRATASLPAFAFRRGHISVLSASPRGRPGSSTRFRPAISVATSTTGVPARGRSSSCPSRSRVRFSPSATATSRKATERSTGPDSNAR